MQRYERTAGNKITNSYLLKAEPQRKKSIIENSDQSEYLHSLTRPAIL